MRFCNECNDKMKCNNCNNQINEDKVFGAKLNPLRRQAPNLFGHSLSYFKS